MHSEWVWFLETAESDLEPHMVKMIGSMQGNASFIKKEVMATKYDSWLVNLSEGNSKRGIQKSFEQLKHFLYKWVGVQLDYTEEKAVGFHSAVNLRGRSKKKNMTFQWYLVTYPVRTPNTSWQLIDPTLAHTWVFFGLQSTFFFFLMLSI